MASPIISTGHLTQLDYFPSYPSTESNTHSEATDTGLIDPALYYAIGHRDEFTEYEVPRNEEEHATPYQYLTNQKMVGRLVSPWSPIRSLLLFHRTGAGKSGEVIRAVTSILYRNGRRTNAKSAIYIIRGKNTLGKSFKEELGKREPIYSESGKLANARIAGDYIIEAYDNVVKTILEYTSVGKLDNLVKEYSGRVLIFDEAHRLVVKDVGSAVRTAAQSQDDGGVAHYTVLHDFLHRLTDSVVFLITATPVRDQVSEFSKLMNLILPLGHQLPSKFDEQFVKKDEKDVVVLNGLKHQKGTIDIEKLEPYIRGRVSYLEAPPSQVEVEHNENTIVEQYQDKNLPQYQLEMQQFQWEAYSRAVDVDIKIDLNKAQKTKESEIENEEVMMDDAEGETKGTGLMSNIREACEFVFPDGSWGKKGSSKYLFQRDDGRWGFNNIFFKDSKINKTMSVEEKLTILAKYSIKYADAIRSLFNGKRGIRYWHSFLVTGSGFNVMAALLNDLFNISQLVSARETLTKKMRFVYLTSANSSSALSLLGVVNRASNCTGDYVTLVLGTKTLTEGVTIKNAVEVRLFQSWWNYAQHYQAFSRVVRQFAHKELLKQFSKKMTEWDGKVHITRYCAVLPEAVWNARKQEDIFSLMRATSDTVNYVRSAYKDVLINSLNQALKQCAIDRRITRRRNLTTTAELSFKLKKDDQTLEDPGLTKRAFFCETEIAAEMARLMRLFVPITDRITTWDRLLSGVQRPTHPDDPAIPSEIREETDDKQCEYVLLSALERLIENHIPIQLEDGRNLYIHADEKNNFYATTTTDPDMEQLIYDRSYFAIYDRPSTEVETNENDSLFETLDTVDFSKIENVSDREAIALKTRHMSEGVDEPTANEENVGVARAKKFFQFAFSLIQKEQFESLTGIKDLPDDPVEMYVGGDIYQYWSEEMWKPVSANAKKKIKAYLTAKIDTKSKDRAYRGVIGLLRQGYTKEKEFAIRLVDIESMKGTELRPKSHTFKRIILSLFEIRPEDLPGVPQEILNDLPEIPPLGNPETEQEYFFEILARNNYRLTADEKSIVETFSENQLRTAEQWFDPDFVRVDRNKDKFEQITKNVLERTIKHTLYVNKAVINANYSISYR